MMVYGKKIVLFLVNGTAESLVLAELRNWSERPLKFLGQRSLDAVARISQGRVFIFSFVKLKMRTKMRFISGKPKTSKHVWYSICEMHRQGTKNTIGIQPLFLQETIWIRR